MSAPAPALDFEAQFAREIVESERLRTGFLAALFGFFAVLILGHWWAFRAAPVPFVSSGTMLAGVLAVTGCLVAYELLVRAALGRMLRRGTAPPPALRYANALVETSVPTLLILSVSREVEPIVVMQGPAVFLYAVFIILSTLRLDFRLCAFTGAVAAVEYAALALRSANPDAGPTEAILSAPSLISAKATVLFCSGIVAGLVTLQLRRRIAKAFYVARERERVLSAFGQQVSPAVAEEILRQGPGPGGRRAFVCVMFMDIRDFTRFAEHRPPEEIVALQNAVFGAAVEAVNRHHGVINQFLGDGFMATFGAPLATGKECLNAVAAAQEIISAMKNLGDARQGEPVRIGIGLHCGEAVTGNVGSAARRQYSVTGNVVILASRIEQLNKQFASQLLLSREVLERAGEAAGGAQPLGPVTVKGREAPVEIFRLD